DRNTDELLLRFWHFPVVTLGPGRRLGLWLQGCSIHCPGCIAPENQPFDRSFAVSVDTLMEELAPALAERPGVTISGGEPLDQKEALLDLLGRFNALGIRDILLYSGYLKEKILAACPELPERIAALIDGPYVEGAATSAPWKGSENQKLTIFREEYRERYEVWSEDRERRMQLVRKGTERYLIGIPRQEDPWRENIGKGV
ncbi:MAG: radical SAM protein, partial [Deltaproteobacteria bacterium]|nr:radical SAM protein [Deltaproteobacteria bacterium]